MTAFPSELCPKYCGKGIGVMQLPNQIAPALAFLNQLRIRSYVEVGCGSGGTFMLITELLRKSNALQGAACVDSAPPAEHEPSSAPPFAGILYEYLKQHPVDVGFYVGRAVQYSSSHPSGPVPVPVSPQGNGTTGTGCVFAPVWVAELGLHPPFTIPFGDPPECCICCRCVSPLCTPLALVDTLCVSRTGLRLVFLNGNSFNAETLGQDFAALDSQADVVMLHGVTSEGSKGLFDELSSSPSYLCLRFADQYPSSSIASQAVGAGSRPTFGIGVCVRRVHVPPAVFAEYFVSADSLGT